MAYITIMYASYVTSFKLQSRLCRVEMSRKWCIAWDSKTKNRKKVRCNCHNVHSGGGDSAMHAAVGRKWYHGIMNLGHRNSVSGFMSWGKISWWLCFHMMVVDHFFPASSVEAGLRSKSPATYPQPKGSSYDFFPSSSYTLTQRPHGSPVPLPDWTARVCIPVSYIAGNNWGM